MTSAASDSVTCAALAWTRWSVSSLSWMELFPSGSGDFTLSTIQGLVFVHISSLRRQQYRLFGVLYNIAKPFLSERVKENIVFHGYFWVFIGSFIGIIISLLGIIWAACTRRSVRKCFLEISGKSLLFPPGRSEWGVVGGLTETTWTTRPPWMLQRN